MPSNDEIDRELLGEDGGQSPPAEPEPRAPSPFSPPTTLGGGARLPPLDPMGYGPSQQFPSQQFSRQPRSSPAPRSSGIPTFYSLESLYGHVPELGTSDARLRVERLDPQHVPDGSGGRVAVAGIIAYLTQPVSTEHFAQAFGGRKYRVFAERAVQSNHDSGHIAMMDVAMAEFTLPLDPNLEKLPIAGEDEDDPYMEPSDPYRRFSPGRRNGSAIHLHPQQGAGFRPGDAADLIRLGAEMTRGGGSQAGSGQESPLTFLSGLSQQQQEQMKMYIERQEVMFREQLHQKDAAFAELRAEMREMRSRPTSQGEILGGVAQLVGAMKGSTTDVEMSQVRSAHEREIDRLNDQFQRERDAMRREHERDINARVAEYKADKERWTERERDMLRDADRQAQMAREEMERRERAAKTEAEREISMLRQTHDMTLSTIRQSYEEKLKMAEMHAQVMGKQTETSTNMIVQGLQRDLASESAEKARLMQENADLRAKVNKTVEEALDEAHRLAGKTGWIPREEATQATGGEDNRSSTDRILERLADGMAAATPAIVQGLGSFASNLGKRSGQSQQQQQPPQRVNVRVDQSQQPRFVESGEDFVHPRQLEQPREQEPQQQQPRRRQRLEQPQPQQQRQQPQQAHPQPEPQNGNPWQGFEWTTLEPAALQDIFSTISGTIEAGGSPENALASLKEKHGEQISLVGTFAPVDQVLASVHQAPATSQSNLATKQGRKFLRTLWGLMSSAPAPTEQGVEQ